jgi:predicted  nucleic acid-binding Zn-ribbon protein
MRTIEALRAEVKELKPKAQAGQTAQQRLQELEDAQKSDLERAQAKVAALEAQVASAQAAHRDALIRAAVEREAHAQGAVKADVVYRLVDRAAIELGADGEVKGADKAVKALLDAEPYLKGATESRPGVPATPRANGNPGADRVEENRQKLAATGAYRPL